MATTARESPRWAVMFVVSGLVLALLAWASLKRVNFRPAVEPPRPIAVTSAPRGGPKRVVLLVLDGLRLDVSERMPTLQWLRSRGASGVAESQLPTLSRPSYTTMATGVPPAQSGVRNNAASWPVPLDTIFDRVRAAGKPTAGGANLAWWNQNFGHGIDTWIPAGRSVEEADGVVGQVLAKGAALTLIHLVNLDSIAHHYGVKEGYEAEAARLDAMLERHLQRLDLTRTALIVTSDHGHRDRGGHGGPEREVVRVPLIVAGVGATRGDLGDVGSIGAIGPMIAVLLGVPVPAHSRTPPLWRALDSETLGSQYIIERRAQWQAQAPSPQAETALLASGFSGPFMALALLVALVVFVRWDVRRTSSTRALLTLPVVGAGPLLAMMLMDLPLSLSGIVEIELLVSVLAVGTAAGNLVHLALVRRLTSRAGVLAQLRASAFVYGSIAPMLWLAFGYAHPHALPGPTLFFLPLPAAFVGGTTCFWVAALALLWSRARQRSPAGDLALTG